MKVAHQCTCHAQHIFSVHTALTPQPMSLINILFSTSEMPPGSLHSQLLLNAHEHQPVSAVVVAAAPAVVSPSQTQQAAPGS